MKSRQGLLIVCVTLLATGLFAGLVLAGEAQYDGPPVTLIWSNYYPETSEVAQKCLKPYIQHITEQTNGKIQFREYWAGTMHGFFDGFKACKNGVTDITQAYIVNAAASFDLANLGEMPFAFKNNLICALVMEQLYPKYFKNEYEKQGVYLASYPAIGMSTGLISKKPVHTLEDLKGLKVVTGGGVISETFKMLGASPVSVSASELFSAMQRGVVDAVASAKGMVIPRQLHEVGKYYIELDANMMGITYCLNKNTFNKLDPVLQKELYTALRQANFIMTQNYLKMDDNAEQQLKDAGVEFITLAPEEMDRIQTAVAPIWDNFVSKAEAKGLPAKQMIEEMHALAAQYSNMSEEELREMVWTKPVPGIIDGM